MPTGFRTANNVPTTKHKLQFFLGQTVTTEDGKMLH